jgi:hypothetical protein
MMITSDFELIADILKSSKPKLGERMSQFEQWEWTVEVFAARLKVKNPRLDVDAFKFACGIK